MGCKNLKPRSQFSAQVSKLTTDWTTGSVFIISITPCSLLTTQIRQERLLDALSFADAACTGRLELPLSGSAIVRRWWLSTLSSASSPVFQYFPLFSRKAAQFYLAELHRAHAFQWSEVIPSLSNTPTLTLTISLLCCGQIPTTDRLLVEKATAFHDTSNKKSCFLDFWLLLSNG